MEFTELIKTIMGGDEFLSKAFILSMFTGLMVYLKDFPKAIWKRIKRLFVFVVTIEQTDELFDYLERWFQDNHSNKYRDVLATINYKNFAINGNKVDEENNFSDIPPEGVEYRHNQDIIFITKNNVIIKVDKGRDKLENAKSLKDLYFDKYKISVFFFKKRIQMFLDEVVKYNQQFKGVNQGISIYVPNYAMWRRVRMLNSKKVDDVILDKNIKKSILNTISLFSEREEWYKKRFIPWTYGLLFWGSPGNGKTSLALALAHYLKRDIYAFIASEIEGDNCLNRLYSAIGNNAIVLIEDVDSIFLENRKSKDHEITFSSLLNCIDGIHYKEGIITIMTTNHFDRLDEALIRPGRIDMRVNFENPKEPQVKEYLELFYGTKFNGVPYKENGYSMATIQNYCLNNSEQGIKKILFGKSNGINN